MLPGTLPQIGPYAPVRSLGEGSTTFTYLYRYEQRKKYVVIKLTRAPLITLEEKEAFLTRAKLLKKLKHRNMSEVMDFGLLPAGEPADDYGYLAVQYIEGQTIRERFTPGQLHTPDEIRSALFPLADTLQYAHTMSAVHGNLHPGNVLLAGKDVFLTDFSLPAPASHPTHTQALLYQAPEQLRDPGGPGSAASDQYALAVMAYEWLCGRRPYPAGTATELLLQQEREPLPAPSDLNSQIKPRIEQILLQALALNPIERFPRAVIFFDAFLYALMDRPFTIPTAPEPASTAQVAVGTAILSSSAPSNSKNNLPKTSLHASVQTLSAEPPAHQAGAEIHGGKLITQAVPRAKRARAVPTQTATEPPAQPEVSNQAETKPSLPTQTISAPLAETEKIARSPLPATVSDLQRRVEADLRQGGALSSSLSGYEERSAQIEMASLVARSLNEEIPAIIEASTGTGKALDVETPIPTPDGWKRMGDLQVGDLVFDEQGQPTRVISAFEMMHNRPCYEVVFSDGSTLVADAEHEWACYTDLAEQRCADHACSLLTTEQIAAALVVHSPGRSNHAIALAAPLALPDANLPIKPYLLGARLAADNKGEAERGERRKSTSSLHVETHYARWGGSRRQAPLYTGSWGDKPLAKGIDAKIAARPITIRAVETAAISPGTREHRALRNLPLSILMRRVTSQPRPGNKQGNLPASFRPAGSVLLPNKHIPAIYLRSSEQQRRALLAGLLDTDGEVKRNGSVEFTTTNPRLAQDVSELLCSLGLQPTCRQGLARCNGKDCGPRWTLAFTTDRQVFRPGRKIEEQKERLRNYSSERNRFRYVVAVNQVPSRPVRCIQVEAPSHLYLAGRAMVPTHNSLSYLIPVVRSGRVAIISTANKALQEQLFFKDIPFVQKYIRHFEAALVKGMSNYLCLSRLEQEQIGIQHYVKNSDFLRLVKLVEESDEGFTGDFETLGFSLPGDIRSKVHADRDQCAWSKCGYFSDCYVRKMKEKADHAKVIVVNHTLLLLDALIEGRLLPERDVIVVDEAHHLEEEATRAFTITISQGQVTTLLAQHLLKEHTPPELQEEAKGTMVLTWDRLTMVADPVFKGRANLKEPLEEGLGLATVLNKLAQALDAAQPQNLNEQDKTLYEKLVTRAKNLAADVRTVFSVDQLGRYVYYVERVNSSGRRGFQQVEVSAAPLEVTSWLKTQLFDKSNVICTSATLATIGPDPAHPGVKGPNFAYFRRRVGLDAEDYPAVQERILPLTFDYQKQALLYLPRHLPEPAYGTGLAAQAYTQAIAQEMMHLVEASRGRAFLLFSSKRMLDEVFEVFMRELPTHLTFPLLRQGDTTRLELVQRFRKEAGAVLFGLKSFWEGVDIIGEALSLVVIDKLPFDPPDDPVHEARVAQMKAAGENWFGTYVLPQTVLRLKQGLGRLLRSHEDRGVMAILDTRLYTKNYGKQIVLALPPARRTLSLNSVIQFFQPDNDEDEAPF